MTGNKDDRLKVVMKELAEIVPYEKNPRKNDRTVQKLKQSIDRFGFKNPIVIDENNTIVCGHARVKAAMMCGLKKIPCVYASGLTEDEIKAFRIADNKTAEIAGWDYDKLCTEMHELFQIGFDLDFTGFNDMEQMYFAEPEKEPEPVDRNEYADYQAAAEDNVLKSFNVTIVCETEEDKLYLKELIGETGHLKRLYDIASIRNMNGEEEEQEETF